MDYKDYYAILGVPRTADEQTIKSAYRRLARVYHPDVNSDKAAATEKFKEINEAYTVLSDPEKRRTYDSFDAQYQRYQRSSYRPTEAPRGAGAGYNRTEPPRPSAAGAAGSSRQQQQQRTTRTISEEEFEQIFRGFAWVFGAGRSGSQTNSGDFSDFFEALFGNRWAGNSSGAASAMRAMAGQDIEMELPVSLEEAFHGATRALQFDDGRRIEVDIPRGVESGTRLRIRQQGARSLFGLRGDLYLTVRVTSHPLFTRQGNDLRVRVKVDADALQRSGEVQIPTLERPVMLKVATSAASGHTYRLRGLGMPILNQPGQRGDLLAVVEIVGAPPTQPKPAAKPVKRASRWTRLWDRLRRLAGFSLLAVGFAGVVAQMVVAGGAPWLLVAALATVLLAQAVAKRSLGLTIASWVALLSSAWLFVQADLALAALPQLGWPLLTLAAGLLVWPRRSRVTINHDHANANRASRQAT